jgi:hypothetical protein
MTQYQHVNSRGNIYYLNSKSVALRGGKQQTIYYFTKDASRAEACELPSGWEVVENSHNGFLTIRHIR